MLIHQIKNKLSSSQYFNTVFKNKKIGLAVSGGVDSMVMLDIFCKISREYNLKLYVMHYNHKWRKKSYIDAELVKKYCQKNKIRFLYKENKGQVFSAKGVRHRTDPPGRRSASGGKNEEIARNERYSFFEQCAKKFSLKVVCTAHHRDDQLETVLFRLARGTGPNGLYPIKEFRELPGGMKISGPLLDLWKKDIFNYALKNKVSYREDKTNLDVTYKRNLIRRKILPLLKKINPEVENNILAFSDLAYSQYVALNTYFSLLLKKIKIGSPLTLNRNKFLKLDYYTQTAFIYWFFTLHGIKGAVSKINVIRDAIINQKKVDLSKKYIMNVVKDKIIFYIKSEVRHDMKSY